MAMEHMRGDHCCIFDRAAARTLSHIDVVHENPPFSGVAVRLQKHTFRVAQHSEKQVLMAWVGSTRHGVTYRRT